VSVPGATKACVRWVNAPAIRRFDSPVYDRSKRRVGTGSVIFACLLLGSVAFAAEASIEEMVISGVMINPRPVQATQYRLEDLEQVRPLALPDILLQAPGAVVGTNSRGETLVQFRNGSERQTQLFFDGAPLTVPWDQRLDLSLVPTTALGRVVVTTGPSSVCFGPNSAGGVIELVPAAPLDQPIAEGRLEGGQGGLVVADGFGAVRTGDLLVSLGAGHRRQNGAPLARDLPFSQPEDDLRLNTDLRRTNALARLAYDGGQAGSVAASLLYVRGGFGIAPESAFSPEAVAVRFWRYPDVEHWAAVLHGERPIGQTIYLTTTAWAQNFDQRIDSFADADYALLEDRQDDDNFTWGGRATLRYESDATTVRLHAQGLTSEHVQTDTAFTAAVPLEQTDRFAQRLFTFGAEAEQRFGDTVVLAGLSGNRFIPTATGGRPDSGTFAGIEAVAGVRGHWGAAGLWRVSAGRKVRFPTLRELFDTAIDRFLINPDLKPERAYLAEAELGWQTASADLAVIGFFSHTEGLIDQQTVLVDGQPLRQRINLDAVRAAGVEASLRASLATDLSLGGHVTWARVRRRGDDGFDRIAERPSVTARLDLVFRPQRGLGGTLELTWRGQAFSFTDFGTFVALNRSAQLNLEVNYARGPALFYVRLDNVSNAFVEPQLGLPAPGRWLRGGIRIAY